MLTSSLKSRISMSHTTLLFIRASFAVWAWQQPGRFHPNIFLNDTFPSTASALFPRISRVSFPVHRAFCLGRRVRDSSAARRLGALALLMAAVGIFLLGFQAQVTPSCRFSCSSSHGETISSCQFLQPAAWNWQQTAAAATGQLNAIRNLAVIFGSFIVFIVLILNFT